MRRRTEIKIPKLKSYSREYQKLSALTARLIGSTPPEEDDQWLPPFNLESPTPHASQAEFEADFAVSSEILSNVRAILKQYNTDDDQRRPALDRLLDDIDKRARTTGLHTAGIPSHDVAELINRHVGVTSSAMVGLGTIHQFLQEHVSALE